MEGQMDGWTNYLINQSKHICLMQCKTDKWYLWTNAVHEVTI